MRRLLAGALLVALAACSGGGEPVGRLELEPSTTSSTSPALEGLAARLPLDPLEGFYPADDVLGSGPLDLEAAADASSDPTGEHRRLRRAGFEAGVSRSWLDDAGATAYAALYEFATEEGAAAYDADQRALVGERASGRFEVEGGAGFTTVERSLTTQVALLRRGNRWALVLVAAEGGGRSPDQLRTLAGAVLSGM